MSEKMIFCLGEGRYTSSGIGYQQNYMIFNKKVSESVYKQVKDSLDVKNFKLPIAKWVEYKDLAKDEQNTTAKQLGGLLKILSYKDAWKEMWTTLSSEDKNFFKTISNFDWDIFTKITGIEKKDEEVEEMTMEDVCKALGKTTKIKKQPIMKPFKNSCIGTRNPHKPCHFNKEGKCTVHDQATPKIIRKWGKKK